MNPEYDEPVNEFRAEQEAEQVEILDSLASLPPIPKPEAVFPWKGSPLVGEKPELPAHTSQITHGNLEQFIGTETWYRHALVRSVLMTDGTQFLTENGAAWLIDEIALAQISPQVSKEPFQAWRLTVNRENTAILEATDGDKGGGPVVLFRKEIPFTDFPLPVIDIWVEYTGDDRGNRIAVILLPSEH